MTLDADIATKVVSGSLETSDCTAVEESEDGGGNAQRGGGVLLFGVVGLDCTRCAQPWERGQAGVWGSILRRALRGRLLQVQHHHTGGGKRSGGAPCTRPNSRPR
jgi:hypothetical protein